MRVDASAESGGPVHSDRRVARGVAEPGRRREFRSRSLGRPVAAARSSAEEQGSGCARDRRRLCIGPPPIGHSTPLRRLQPPSA